MDYKILTDIGEKRQTNQDYAGTFLNQAGTRLFLLADGMGGHRSGDVASKLAVEDIGELWESTGFTGSEEIETIEAWMRRQVLVENENIANLGKLDDYKGMGTTLEMLYIGDTHVITGHIGDSKQSLIRNRKLVPLTHDHSLVQELVDAGQITEEEAETHPNKNIITRSLGQNKEAIPDTESFTFTIGDHILMNSDGLTNMISTEEILEIIGGIEPVETKAQKLITLANANGGLDNITVILVKFDGGDFA
ncbi:MAG: Stp1/IreP family PP2C-type Ser/Thr phosphatase [Streptococcaceae bacterium]|jgi:protein phosphatase|nr:Stp1/IreP family PP2C-type Ser/Thr phosphatase [Streptococcaceae bacterium]